MPIVIIVAAGSSMDRARAVSTPEGVDSAVGIAPAAASVGEAVLSAAAEPREIGDESASKI